MSHNPFDDDIFLDQQLGQLLRDTPESPLPGDLAVRAMRLAAAPGVAPGVTPNSKNWIVLFNVLAAIAISAIVLIGAWSLSLSASSDAVQSGETAMTSNSQWFSLSTDQLLIGAALIVAAAGAQIVLRAPAAFPRLPAIRPA